MEAPPNAKHARGHHDAQEAPKLVDDSFRRVQNAFEQHNVKQDKKIQKLKDINAKNADLIGNCSKNIKEIHKCHGEILAKIDEAQEKIGDVLSKKRAKIFETFDEKINEMKE